MASSDEETHLSLTLVDSYSSLHIPTGPNQLSLQDLLSVETKTGKEAENSFLMEEINAAREHTLAAFKAFLQRNHCTEVWAFRNDVAAYKALYGALDGSKGLGMYTTSNTSTPVSGQLDGQDSRLGRPGFAGGMSMGAGEREIRGSAEYEKIGGEHTGKEDERKRAAQNRKARAAWHHLITTYILSNAEEEINLPADVRDELLAVHALFEGSVRQEYRQGGLGGGDGGRDGAGDDTGDKKEEGEGMPPSPEVLIRAKELMEELMNGIFIQFLESGGTTPTAPSNAHSSPRPTLAEYNDFEMMIAGGDGSSEKETEGNGDGTGDWNQEGRKPFYRRAAGVWGESKARVERAVRWRVRESEKRPSVQEE